MKWMGCLAILGALGATTQPDEGPARLNFRQHRFSIQELEGTGGTTPCMVLMMSLPPTDGFSPNVNVMVQPYADSLDEYAALSRRQFEQAGVRKIKEAKRGKDAVAFEYAGKMDEQDMHWYAVAHKRGNEVYLITATAAEKHWEKVSGKLRDCVDSFQFDPPAKAVAPAP